MGRGAQQSKSGKRADLNDRFFRSSWEANYARYLNWMIEQGKYKSWEYEPKTFVFNGVTRGQLTYTPDFRVTNVDNTYDWHEVKGWMDAKSKAKLKRMAKFYPDEHIIVIGAVEYKALSKWSAMIPNWESGSQKVAKAIALPGEIDDEAIDEFWNDIDPTQPRRTGIGD